MIEQNYDVVAVNIKTGATRLIAEDKTLPNAEAVVKMAVLRLGVETEFYKVVFSHKEQP